MTSAIYELTAVQVRFGSRLALDIDSLTIRKGYLHVLIGPNGSGKSTLLSVMASLTKPDHGRITFCGLPLNWSPKQLGHLRKQETLLHQESYLFSGTVMANVGLGLRMRGVDQKEVRRSVKHFLALVGLAGFEERDARALSGGEARRVALARALACRPQVLLLDEPMAHVDQKSAEIIEELIASQSRAGTTIVMASHDEHAGEGLSSSMVRLKEGRIEASDHS
ncbi:ATP-binding cassette domain-containing protein [Edaphobacter aggregans]|uniref:ATP-binding cassette domain-containing protein n=1 Tax=Edaphobacter aggregans TaxID=570835 RepID=UPI000553B770|nr:ATP-binding cassette domain-containing protein [Edaphobacter aggregans]